MKILITVDSLRSDEGGPPRSVPALAKAIAQLDVPVELWTLAGKETVEGLQIRRFGSSFELARELKRIGSQRLLIHDNGLWRPFNWIVCRTALSLGIPYVVSTRGMLEPWCLERSRWKKRLAWRFYQRHLLECAAGLHATGTPEAKTLRSLGLRAPIIVQPNGVEIPSLGHRRTASRSALYLSRIHVKKGIEVLLDAWSRLRPKGWRLQIAGPGDRAYLAKLKALCAKQDIAGSVEWLGEVDDTNKWALFANAEVFILPSFSENFGIVVAESLASGVPVITTTATPWLDLETKECGYCIAPDVHSLAAALEKLISMPQDERRQMGANGRAWMERDFSWTEIARNMIEFYRTIVPGSTTAGIPLDAVS